MSKHRAGYAQGTDSAMEVLPMPPLALSDEQLNALIAAAHPLPAHSRSAFLEACAKELAALPEVGDGALHRIVTKVQRIYFDPPTFGRGIASKYG